MTNREASISSRIMMIKSKSADGKILLDVYKRQLRTCNRVMAHRPTGSTQTDRIRLPYAARRLSLSRWGPSPASAKEERVSRLPSARAERIRCASRPGSVGFPDSASCGYPRTHEAFRPCHRGYGYTSGSYSRRSTAALAPWPRCHRRRPHGSPKRAAGPFPCGYAHECCRCGYARPGGCRQGPGGRENALYRIVPPTPAPGLSSFVQNCISRFFFLPMQPAFLQGFSRSP